MKRSTAAARRGRRRGRSAAPRARARARDDPRGVRRQERPLRDDARRPRDVRLPPGRPVRVHPAAVRLVPRGDLPAVRSLVARGRARTDRRRGRDRARRLRDRDAAPLARRRPRRRDDRDAPPVRRLARRPPEPRGARRARRWRSLALCALAAYERQLASARRGDGRRRRAWRSSGTRASLLLPVGIAVYVAWRTPVGHGADGGRARHRDGRGGRRAVGRAEQGRRSAATRSRRTRARSGRRTTRTRARCSIAAAGSTTSRSFPARRPWPELAADLTLAGKPTSGRRVRPDAAVPRRGRRLLARAPGREGTARAPGDAHALEPGAARVGRERKRRGAHSRGRRSSPRS